MSVSASVSSPFIRRPIATSLLGVAVMLGGTLGYCGFRSRRCASAPAQYDRRRLTENAAPKLPRAASLAQLDERDLM